MDTTTTDILTILTLDDGNLAQHDTLIEKMLALNITLADVSTFAQAHKIKSSLALRVFVVKALLDTPNVPVGVDPRWTQQQVSLIKHYTSGSGNATWKCTLAAGGEVYIRQVNKALWLEAGYAVNEMKLDDEWAADITIYTADGEKGFLDVKHIAPGGTLTKPESRANDLVQAQAREWLDTLHYIIDTETTGTGPVDEVVQISIIDSTGTILLDTLVKPTRFIPADATAIHGITNEMVADGPSIDTLCIGDVPLADWLMDNEDSIITYNAKFDGRLLAQSFKAHKAWAEDIDAYVFNCAMTLYAEHHGDWNELKENYKFISLVNACAAMDVPFVGTAHSALGDAQATLALIKALAAGPRFPF